MLLKEECISIITTKIKSDPTFNRYKKNLELLLKPDFQWLGVELSLSATDMMRNDERVKTSQIEMLNSLQEFIGKINNLSYIGLVKKFDTILINIKNIAAEKKNSSKDLGRLIKGLQDYLKKQLDFYLEIINDKNISSISPDGKVINYNENTPEENKKSYQQRMEKIEEFTLPISEQEVINLIKQLAGQCPPQLEKMISKDILWLDLHDAKLQQQLATHFEVQEVRQKIIQKLYDFLISLQDVKLEPDFVLKLLLQIIKESDELNTTEDIAQLKVDEKYFPFYLKRVRLQQDYHLKYIDWITQVRKTGAVLTEVKNEINASFIPENTKIYKEMMPILEAELANISNDEFIIKLVDKNYSWLNNISKIKIACFGVHPDFIESKVEFMLILRHFLSIMKNEHSGILLLIKDYLKEYNADQLWHSTDTKPDLAPNVVSMFYDHLVGVLGACLTVMNPNVLVAVLDGEFIFTPDVSQITVDKFKQQLSKALDNKYKFANALKYFTSQGQSIPLKDNQVKSSLLEQNDFIKNIQDENLSWTPMNADDIAKLKSIEEYKTSHAQLLLALNAFLDQMDQQYLSILHYLATYLDRILKQAKVPPEHLSQFVVIFQKLQIDLLKAYTHLLMNKCTQSINEDGVIVYKDDVPFEIKLHYKEHLDTIYDTFINESKKIKNEQTAVQFNSLLIRTYRQQNTQAVIPKGKSKSQHRF